MSGRTSVPLTVPANPYFTLLRQRPQGYFQFDALRDAALREMLAQDRAQHLRHRRAALRRGRPRRVVGGVSDPAEPAARSCAPFFAGLDTPVAAQLKTIAQLIEGRAQTQMRRQVFYVAPRGYDTHGSQAGIQQALLGDLSRALKAFEDAMNALGLANSVTTFTLSEFGRTFKPAANAGTDHGWGNYAFVDGRRGEGRRLLRHGADAGAQRSGRPRQRRTLDSDDVARAIRRDAGALVRHRREPTLPYIFPNIGAFANTNLGFMA